MHKRGQAKNSCWYSAVYKCPPGGSELYLFLDLCGVVGINYSSYVVTSVCKSVHCICRATVKYDCFQEMHFSLVVMQSGNLGIRINLNFGYRVILDEFQAVYLVTRNPELLDLNFSVNPNGQSVTPTPLL